MKLPPSEHAIWKSLNAVIILGAVIVFSLTTASNIDETEYKMWTGMVVFLGGFEALKPLARKWMGIKESEKDA